MRYLVDTSFFDLSAGCVLFYAGGYKDIVSYYKGAGYVTGELAKGLGALIIFGEHRYFGSSADFPD
jgi:hypothetical protein